MRPDAGPEVPRSEQLGNVARWVRRTSRDGAYVAVTYGSVRALEASRRTHAGYLTSTETESLLCSMRHRSSVQTEK